MFLESVLELLSQTVFNLSLIFADIITTLVFELVVVHLGCKLFLPQAQFMNKTSLVRTIRDALPNLNNSCQFFSTRTKRYLLLLTLFYSKATYLFTIDETVPLPIICFIFCIR